MEDGPQLVARDELAGVRPHADFLRVAEHAARAADRALALSIAVVEDGRSRPRVDEVLPRIGPRRDPQPPGQRVAAGIERQHHQLGRRRTGRAVRRSVPRGARARDPRRSPVRDRARSPRRPCRTRTRSPRRATGARCRRRTRERPDGIDRPAGACVPATSGSSRVCRTRSSPPRSMRSTRRSQSRSSAAERAAMATPRGPRTGPRVSWALSGGTAVAVETSRPNTATVTAAVRK